MTIDREQSVEGSTGLVPPSLTTRGHWFGPPKSPVSGWFSERATGALDTGVLLLAPIGYEYWTTHRAMRNLAERLALIIHVV